MTPEDFCIAREQNRIIIDHCTRAMARDFANACKADPPATLVPATEADVVRGRILWYPDRPEGAKKWEIVRGLFQPVDRRPDRFYLAEDYSDTGIEGAYVDADRLFIADFDLPVDRRIPGYEGVSAATHDVVLDGAGVVNNMSRYTCRTCPPVGATIVCQPYMTRAVWAGKVLEFLTLHPCPALFYDPATAPFIAEFLAAYAPASHYDRVAALVPLHSAGTVCSWVPGGLQEIAGQQADAWLATQAQQHEPATQATASTQVRPAP